MRISFRAEAETDLRGIIAWYEDVAPEALGNILPDIHRAIDRLTRYPKSGPEIAGTNLRRIVTLRYHFKIAYQIADDAIHVVGIFRFQDREQ